jgi:outer membrane protein assembly factor BamB
VGTPVYSNGILFVPTRRKPLLAFNMGGSGDISESHLRWKYADSGTADVPSPLCDGSYLYVVEDRGMVTCLKAGDGSVVWGPERTAEGIVSASPVLADGRIYIVNESGVTSVVASGAAFKHLATNELDGSYTLASPAVAGTGLLIRTEKALYCISK